MAITDRERDQRQIVYPPEAGVSGTTGETRVERRTEPPVEVREEPRVEVHEEPRAEFHAAPREEEKVTAEWIAGGSLAEAVAGVAAIVLAIVGLAGMVPFYMLTIATIVLGAGLLLEGGAMAARFSSLLGEVGGGSLSRTELGSSTGIEFLGGAAAIVLGILGLIGLVPLTLSAVAAIVIGGTLLLSAAGNSRLNRLAGDLAHGRTSRDLIAREAVNAATGAQALIGIAVIVLGIIGLVGVTGTGVSMDVTLVAMLVAGCSLLLSGAAVGSRMVSVSR